MEHARGLGERERACIRRVIGLLAEVARAPGNLTDFTRARNTISPPSDFRGERSSRGKRGPTSLFNVVVIEGDIRFHHAEGKSRQSTNSPPVCVTPSPQQRALRAQTS